MRILEGLYALHGNDNDCVSRLEQFEKNDCNITIQYLIRATTDEKVQEVVSKKCIVANSTIDIELINDARSQHVSEIMSLINCTREEAAKIYHKSIDLPFSLTLMKSNFDFLTSNGITTEAIKENFESLLLTPDDLEHKMKIISRISSSNISDFLPLLSVDSAILENYATAIKDEDPAVSPINYFSMKLNVSLNIFLCTRRRRKRQQ